MSRNRSLAIAAMRAARAISLAGLPLLSAACGPGDEGGLLFKIDRALVVEAVAVDVSVFEGDRSCQSIRAEWPRPTPLLGPLRRAVGDDERASGFTVRFDAVPEGTYVVFADALDAHDSSVGSGCAPAQMVSSRQLSRSRVVIGG